MPLWQLTGCNLGAPSAVINTHLFKTVSLQFRPVMYSAAYPGPSWDPDAITFTVTASKTHWCFNVGIYSMLPDT